MLLYGRLFTYLSVWLFNEGVEARMFENQRNVMSNRGRAKMGKISSRWRLTYDLPVAVN
jgi:hypothetical protein